ncbi:MAG: Ig-like domain-containing protein [Alphaproteobacteria bacterium]|jgi:RNA polymerase sigma-70 factor (ECF subfamily)|nr:Ig-like domain-containing protein [Alphaproteobacteria bacterium]MDP6563766.1 Ig-like domain-containing protein [Alphaproteobacteria bacterium]
MRWFKVFLSALLIAGSAGPALADGGVSVQGTPPVVVKTVPRAGDTKVDPATREIRVTFSKDMMTKNMWSWVIHTKDTFPEITGAVRYLADGRTCVAPVKLSPGRTYAIWFNSPNYRHNAFRDRSNNPAVPYLLVFETGQ